MCQEGIIRQFYSYLRQKGLGDFMTCNALFNIQSEGVHIKALEHCGKINLVYMFIIHSYTKREQCYASVILLWEGKDFIV